MSPADPHASQEPLRQLIAGWNDDETARSEEFGHSLDAVEAAVRELEQLSGRMEQRLAEVNESMEAERQQARERQESETQRRQRLEHDLGLARSRVVELERHLQQRTEELLEAQSANNALAAQLQEAGDVPFVAPLEEAPSEAPHDGPEPFTEEPDTEGSVADRFARLRNQSA